VVYIDPQQELFTACKLGFEQAGQSVFDGVLPPEDTPYPFTYLGDFQQIDTANKTAINGKVSATIHTFSDTPKNRGTLSAMMLEQKRVCREIKRTQNFSWYVTACSQRIIPDNTTKTPLLHGILDIEFQFN
jgi:hypothetical protein